MIPLPTAQNPNGLTPAQVAKLQTMPQFNVLWMLARTGWFNEIIALLAVMFKPNDFPQRDRETMVLPSVVCWGPVTDRSAPILWPHSGTDQREDGASAARRYESALDPWTAKLCAFCDEISQNVSLGENPSNPDCPLRPEWSDPGDLADELVQHARPLHDINAHSDRNAGDPGRATSGSPSSPPVEQPHSTPLTAQPSGSRWFLPPAAQRARCFGCTGTQFFSAIRRRNSDRLYHHAINALMRHIEFLGDRWAAHPVSARARAGRDPAQSQSQTCL